MRFIDYILIALRNIRRQKLRSALTIFAVVIGATSVTIMLSIVSSAKSFVSSQFESYGIFKQIAVSPDAEITSFDDSNHGGGNQCDKCVKLTESLVTQIKNIPHVTGVARITTSGGFEAVIYNSQKLTLNQVRGYDANGVITNDVIAGRDLAPTDKEGVVTITSDYADKFGFKKNYQAFVGKKIQLLTRDWYQGVGAVIQKPDFGPHKDGQDNQPQGVSTTLTATVVGVVNSNGESKLVRAPLEWVNAMNTMQRWDQTEADRKATEAAQKAQEQSCRNNPGPCSQKPIEPHITLITENMTEKNGYDGLKVNVDATQNVAATTAAIKKLKVGAADAKTMIEAALKIFNILGLVLGGIGGISLAVAAVGVVNTMIMAILERTREIGVMRAVGARRSTIRRLFTFEASLLGFWGGVFGIAVGFGLTRIANIFINKQLSANSIKAHDIIGLPLWLILAVIAATTLIGMLAGLYPAMRAAKLDPVEALRYE